MIEKKPFILLVIDEASVGGGQQHVLWLAEHLDKTKYKVAVVCEPRGYLVDRLHELDILHYPLVISNSFSVRALVQCRNLLKSLMPSIVHTHGGTAGFYGRIAAVIAHVPHIVHTYHGIHYLHWKKSLKRFIFHLTDRMLVVITDMILCVTEDDFNLALRSGLVKKNKSLIIKNGIDVKRFAVSQLQKRRMTHPEKKSQTVVVGTIGRLHEQKGHKYFLEAARIILSEYPETRFHIVGDGDLREQLEQLAIQLGIIRSVQFLGSRIDIPEQLGRMDIFVLSSLWEGLPIVLLEAMAARKPIVSTSVNGIPEILQDGKSALLVPSRDSNALAAAIKILIQNNVLSKRISDCAYRLVCQKYDIKIMISRTEDVYNRLLVNEE